MRAALGKPFSKHCPELHGMNSDGLCLTIRFSVAEAAFKKQFSDGLLGTRSLFLAIANGVEESAPNMAAADSAVLEAISAYGSRQCIISDTYLRR